MPNIERRIPMFEGNLLVEYRLEATSSQVTRICWCSSIVDCR
jgi:hypothetical protein